MKRNFRPVDPLASTPRYTDAATVKALLGIPAANASFDDRIAAAIVAGEVALDQHLGQAFPYLGPHIAEGYWLYAGSTGDPLARELRHEADGSELRLHAVDLDGGDRHDTFADEAPPIERPPYVHVMQAGGHSITLAPSSGDLADDVWSWATTISAGAWDGFTAGAVRVVFLWALAGDEVPAPIADAAASIAVAVYKRGDSPTGQAGSDEWLGTLNVADTVRAEVARNPVLHGFMARDGFGVA